jgi:thiol-disulfide isomerase/thioredoxin
MDNEYLNDNKINSPKDLALLINKKEMIVILKISASWCGPCKNKQFLDSYKKLKSNYSSIKNVKFIDFDIDDDDNIINDNQYYDIKIDSVPTFLISYEKCFVKKFSGTGYLNEINEFIQNIIIPQ